MSSPDNPAGASTTSAPPSRSKLTPSEVQRATIDEAPNQETPTTSSIAHTSIPPFVDTNPESPDALVPNALVQTANPERNEMELPILTGATAQTDHGIILGPEISDSDAESDWSSPVKKGSVEGLGGRGGVAEVTVCGRRLAGNVDDSERGGVKRFIGHEIWEVHEVNDGKGAEGVKAGAEAAAEASNEIAMEVSHDGIQEARPTDNDNVKVAGYLQFDKAGPDTKLVEERSPESTEDMAPVEEQSILKSQDATLAADATSSTKTEGVPVIPSDSAATEEKSGINRPPTKEKGEAMVGDAPFPGAAQETGDGSLESMDPEDVQIAQSSEGEDDAALIPTGEASGYQLGEHSQALHDPLVRADVIMADIRTVQYEKEKYKEKVHSITSTINIDEPIINSPATPALHKTEPPLLASQRKAIEEVELLLAKEEVQEIPERGFPELLQPSNSASTKQIEAWCGPADVPSSPQHFIPTFSHNKYSKENTQLTGSKAPESSLKRPIDDGNSESQPPDIPSSPPHLVSKSPVPKSPGPQNASYSRPDNSQNKDLLMAELKLMKIASIQARNTSLAAEIASKRSKLEEVTKELSNPAADTVKKHIKLLHDYNDIRDVGQGLVGMIADNRGVRIGELYEEFGVCLKD